MGVGGLWGEVDVGVILGGGIRVCVGFGVLGIGESVDEVIINVVV